MLCFKVACKGPGNLIDLIQLLSDHRTIGLTLRVRMDVSCYVKTDHAKILHGIKKVFK